MVPRRAQTPISFRSDKAAARLALLTRSGRSQATIIEEALDRLPVPINKAQQAINLELLRAAFEKVRLSNPNIPTIAEFDALEYDENGDPR